MAVAVNYADFMYSFRVARSFISLFVPQVCKAIFSAYKEVMPDNMPEADRLWISAVFERVGNLPHICWSLNVKHIRIKKPSDFDSVLYKYKNFCMVMMALVDADYKFIWLSVGSYGSTSAG